VLGAMAGGDAIAASRAALVTVMTWSSADWEPHCCSVPCGTHAKSVELLVTRRMPPVFSSSTRADDETRSIALREQRGALRGCAVVNN